MDAKTPLVITHTVSINPATALPVDSILFVCPTGAEYEVLSVAEAHTVAGSNGGAVTGDIKKHSAGTAPSAGTSVLGSTFNLKSTANTPVTKTTASGIAAAPTRYLTAGQMLSLDFTGTLTALEGCCITIALKLRRAPTYR